MLMSKSRLEKFLYALYSLDSSDLPNPLSRIEELYKCLVTGEEVPTFEPLSIVEKYLMAILGVYDVDSLPNPLSRVEVLLYKLATGDDNLDDIKSFLSEHEELLAEIIRNGGVGGNIDIEYVLYTLSTEFNTLYNTAEKPVKSAILTGQTLVNLVKQSSATPVYLTRTPITSGYQYTQQYNAGSMTATRIQWEDGNGSELFKPLTKYYIQCEIKVNKRRGFRVQSNGTGGVGYSKTLQENSTNSIKGVFTTFPECTIIYLYINPPQSEDLESYTDDIFEIKNLMIIEYQDGMENWDIPYFEGMKSVQMPVVTTSNEDGTKTNILTVNEPIELRGIGDVRDELNLLTGELTQRVGEIVLDGSESWTGDTNGAGVRRYFLRGVGNDLSVDIANSSTLLCDKFTVGSYVWTETNDSVHITKSNGIYFIDSSVDSLDAFVNKLKTSNIKVQYSLIEKPVKTVDLSIVNQDGNNTKLKTFNDITHVTLSSEGLIPEAELEVATKNEEVLNTMSLEMDDISATQTTLEETSNTQSENVDATMIATTEIYEQLL